MSLPFNMLARFVIDFLLLLLLLLSCFSRVRLFATPWTVAYHAPPSMGFSRQGYWSGVPSPSPGDLPDPGIEARSPVLQADSLLSEPLEKPVIVSGKITLGSPSTVLYGDAQNTPCRHTDRALSRVPCAIQLIFINYLFYRY